MKALAWIALGGSLGAVLRHLLSAWIQTKSASAFPYGTLGVNLLGCLLLGLLVGLISEQHAAMRPELRQFLGIGILGAFTTFSTFSYETIALIDAGAWLLAAGNVLISVIGGLLMVILGRALILWLGI